MEETPLDVEAVSERNCAGCGQPAMEGDHATLLCSDCRTQFTRLSIPLWIKLFAGGVAIVLLFSLVKLPASLSLGIHLEKGKDAEKKRNFLTAERELSKVVEKVPGNEEARAHLLIASFYNLDFPTFGKQVKALEHVNMEDKELFTDVDQVMNRAERYFSNDSLENFLHLYPVADRIPDTAWARYLGKHPEDLYAAASFASVLFDKKDYHPCDSILQRTLQSDNEYFPALMMLASVKREEGDLDGALKVSERMLAVNKESMFGLSSKARTLLRQKKDAPGLELAEKAYAIDNSSIFSMSTLIIAYHFNGRMTERDALIRKASAVQLDSTERNNLQYALDVIDKKEKFRD